MQAKLPVLAATDPNTDIGKVIMDGGFGWWCESSDSNLFVKRIETICTSGESRIGELGETGYRYLQMYYDSDTSYRIIKNHLR